MKVDKNTESFHLQQFTAVKEELVQALLQFSKVLSENPLVDVVNRSSFCSEDYLKEQNATVVISCSYKCQVDYIRNFLLFGKIFPVDTRLELGWKVLRDCDILLKEAFQELERESGGDASGLQEQGVAFLILPLGQLIHDCIEMNLSTTLTESFSESLHDEKKLEQAISYSMSIFDESMRFLATPAGISLGKPEFLRILGLGQKVWKFSSHIRNCAKTELERQNLNELIGRKGEQIEELLAGCAISLLSSENGRSLIKFWCEISNLNDVEKESKMYASLQGVSLSSNDFSEIYMVFTSYFEDATFWTTETGKRLTPVLIRAIMADLTCDKVETRKRAAFVLRLLVDQYSQNVPIFDKNIPEVSLISLNSMKCDEYVKFWDSYFDLHDILNETQLHIVQPVLQKLQIFKQHSSNDSVLVWLPIILKKMVGHDNRSVVKEGFIQFLQAGQYLENMEINNTFRQLAKDFLERYIMPLIRDHIGWILNEPEEFFKNIATFGQFMMRLYSNHQLAEFKTAEVILDFLTSSGKCMGPHTIFFLVASLDEIFCSIKSDEEISDKKLTLCMEMLINQLALLLSHNLTTVSKYFRQLLEHRCISILLKTMPLFVQMTKIEMDSFIFMKMLTFMGSLSVKVFYGEKTCGQIQKIIQAINNKEAELLAVLAGGGTRMYHFAKSCLSATSTLGMLRLAVISSQICNNKEISEQIQMTVGNFAELNGNEELLPGSIQGLYEFYQQTFFDDNVAHIFIKMFNELCDMLMKSDDDVSSLNVFMFCIRRQEVLSILPSKILLNTAPLPQLTIPSCKLKAFLLQKLYILKGVNSLSIPILKDITSGGLESFNINDDISENYFSATERNLFAEYFQIQFCMSTCIINDGISKSVNIERDMLRNLLRFIVDNIEKCDSKGVAAGLLLTQSVIKCVDYRLEWDGTHLLDEIVSIGWSLAFDLRKREAFWFAIKAFVELICCPYFVNNGYLDKYADLLFEHGECVSGLQLVLVQHLVKIDYPKELLGEIHQILVKAALAGGPLPKNNRVSFAIWDYKRKDANFCETDYDPENFSSDCKARFMACEKLLSNLDCLLSKDDHKAEALGLLLESVQVVLERDNLESEIRRRYFQGSSTHRIKQRIFQILLTLQPHFDFEISKMVLEKVLTSLSTDSPQPSVRYMGEWLIILIVQRYPELNTLFFECLDNCIQKRLGFGAFFSTICLHTSKLLKCEKFYNRALQSLATLTMGQHLTVRIYSQIAFQKIYERAVELKFTNTIEKYTPMLSALERASTFVSGNCSKLLENVSQDFYVNIFDCVTHYCPEVIFTLLPKLSGMIKDECILLPETIRKIRQGSHCDNEWNNSESKLTTDFEKVYMDHEKSAWHLKSVVTDGRELGEEIPKELPAIELKPLHVENKEMNYQKKINPWKLLSVSEEIDEYSNTGSKKKCVGEDGLIVVASLLDHLPNLGGLCRTCEIFGVHKYVINSLKVVNDQHFQSLSVSAQNWVNILEVPVRDLESFLFTYSAKGYTILGVEQANESSSLTDFHFPKKSVLLLGNEKLGIPPELLRLVDKCIEIPQVGIIRSLNVHVTGALCIWQYASQNIL